MPVFTLVVTIAIATERNAGAFVVYLCGIIGGLSLAQIIYWATE